MSMPLHNDQYTYADYLKWPEGARVELIDGHLYAMSPAPSRMHQEILGNLFVEFSNYLKGKPCQVYIAPFDVRLTKQGEDLSSTKTVVQPDLSIICDESKLDDKGCVGAPDLIVEVVSPHSFTHDQIRKHALYERAGVREYWIVYPAERFIAVYQRIEDGKFDEPQTYGVDDELQPGLFADFTLYMDTIFIR